MNYEYHLIVLILALIIDCLIGDPVYPFHPIRLIGLLVSQVEQFLFSLRLSGYRGGIILWFVVMLLSLSTYFTGHYIIRLLHPSFAFCLNVFIVYSCISCKDLLIHGHRVYTALQNNHVQTARTYASMMVGRDTSSLQSNEIAQATVESLAENSSDGILAPIFYGVLGGPIGILVYKTVNTMDSMIGYRNNRYTRFGYFAAKADDVFNFIPSRITMIFILVSKLWNSAIWKNALKNRKNHFSPNSGHCEAAMAALLNIRMGGAAMYKGNIIQRPIINEDGQKTNPEHIRSAIGVIKIFTGIILSMICLSLLIIFLTRV